MNGTRAYVALPTGDYDKTKALLYLPDVFGLELPNNRLLTDDFAANGYATYLVDYLLDDAIPADALNDGKFDLMGWVGKHDQKATRAPLDKLIAGLREQGVKEFAATGYCFGARQVVDLVIDGVVKVGAVAHPSLLKVPEDLEIIKAKASHIPLLWNTCENDFMFGTEAQAQLVKIFDGAKNYKRNYYAGCDHGFAVRGDLSIPAVKAGKEGAFIETVEWLKAHF